jgi:hypothetical protein
MCSGAELLPHWLWSTSRDTEARSTVKQISHAVPEPPDTVWRMITKRWRRSTSLKPASTLSAFSMASPNVIAALPSVLQLQVLTAASHISLHAMVLLMAATKPGTASAIAIDCGCPASSAFLAARIAGKMALCTCVWKLPHSGSACTHHCTDRWDHQK